MSALDREALAAIRRALRWGRLLTLLDWCRAPDCLFRWAWLRWIAADLDASNEIRRSGEVKG